MTRSEDKPVRGWSANRKLWQKSRWVLVNAVIKKVDTGIPCLTHFRGALGISLLPDHDGRRGENGAELPGGERFQGAQAGVEFRGGQAALAIEAAQKIFRRRFSLLRVAFEAAGNQVAVGIAPPADNRHDMVEDSTTSDALPQAIKAQAALARMNGLASAAHLQEIHLFEGGSAGPGDAGGHSFLVRRGEYLLRQKDFDLVASQGAVDQAHGALGGETAHSLARGRLRHANATGEPKNRKAELPLAVEAAMPHEMGVDHALGKIEAQARHEIILELFPEKLRIGFMVFHRWDPKKSWQFTAEEKSENETQRAQRSRHRELREMKNAGKSGQLTEKDKDKP
jgi:hypothetical protein